MQLKNLLLTALLATSTTLFCMEAAGNVFDTDPSRAATQCGKAYRPGCFQVGSTAARTQSPRKLRPAAGVKAGSSRRPSPESSSLSAKPLTEEELLADLESFKITTDLSQADITEKTATVDQLHTIHAVLRKLFDVTQSSAASQGSATEGSPDFSSATLSAIMDVLRPLKGDLSLGMKHIEGQISLLDSYLEERRSTQQKLNAGVAAKTARLERFQAAKAAAATTEAARAEGAGDASFADVLFSGLMEERKGPPVFDVPVVAASAPAHGDGASGAEADKASV